VTDCCDYNCIFHKISIYSHGIGGSSAEFSQSSTEMKNHDELCDSWVYFASEKSCNSFLNKIATLNARILT
jgi:hypothetical protein